MMRFVMNGNTNDIIKMTTRGIFINNKSSTIIKKKLRVKGIGISRIEENNYNL